MDLQTSSLESQTPKHDETPMLDAAESEDEEMRAAILLSQEAPPAPPPATPATPAPPNAAPQPTAKEALSLRVREVFDELTARGLAANDAAATALRQASEEAAATAAAVATAAAAAPPEHDLLSREGFEARMKQLFLLESFAAGGDASAAAARALQQKVIHLKGFEAF